MIVAIGVPIYIINVITYRKVVSTSIINVS